MKETSRFLRGQVWLWQDPIYGAKEDGNSIPEMEVTTRYSRYVLIIQSNESNGSILIAPCSGSSDFAGNIPVALSDTTGRFDTKILIKCIFPVHPQTLTRYICTVGPDVMRRVDNELLSYIMPDLYEALLYNNVSGKEIELLKFIDPNWMDHINLSDYKYSTNNEKNTNNTEEDNSDKGCSLEEIRLENLPQAISKMGNLVRQWISTTDVELNENDRKILGNSVYYSILSFLRINTSSLDTSHLTDKHIEEKQLKTMLHFLDKIYNDRRLSRETELESIVDKYRDLYPKSELFEEEEYTCMNPSWLTVLEDRLLNRLVYRTRTKRIIFLISDLLCH